MEQGGHDVERPEDRHTGAHGDCGASDHRASDPQGMPASDSSEDNKSAAAKEQRPPKSSKEENGNTGFTGKEAKANILTDSESEQSSASGANKAPGPPNGRKKQSDQTSCS